MSRVMFVVMLFLMCFQIAWAQLPDDDPTLTKMTERIVAEWSERKSIVEGNPKKPYSDQHTGKTFKAIGKEWRVGQYNISWTETQSWVSSLEDGWRAPLRDELKSLQGSIGSTSAIGWDGVWAEKKDSASVWIIGFVDCSEDLLTFDTRDINTRAVAVR